MNKRIFYLDLLRSFAIIMVVLLHSISPYLSEPTLFGGTSWYVNLILNAFTRTGVPLFFMISGALILSSSRTENFAQFYKKRLLHIIIPLVFWNIAYFSFKCIAGRAEFDLGALISGFLDSGTEYHLWYLYTLIGIYLLAPFLKILVNNCSSKQLVLLLFLMLFCTSIRPFINTVTPLYIYFFEPLFNGYIACFLMGYILSKIEYSKKVMWAFISLGVVGLTLPVVLNHIHSSSGGIDLVMNFGYSICHYAMAAALFVIAKLLFAEKALFEKAVSSLSGSSFGIYLIHVAVIDIITNFFMIDASPLASSAYIFVITLAVSWPISYLLGKIKYIKNLVS